MWDLPPAEGAEDPFPKVVVDFDFANVEASDARGDADARDDDDAFCDLTACSLLSCDADLGCGFTQVGDDHAGGGQLAITAGAWEEVVDADGTLYYYNGETGEEGWLRYHVWCNERALDVAEQRVVIMDLANLSKWHLAPGALASLQRMVGLDRRHYPGTVKAYLVLNPPSAVRALFLSAWPAVTSWMDETTLAGVKLLGAVDDAATREELLKHLSEDDLPRHLGGRCAHAVRVHPALRSGFAAVDDEAVAEVPPGQYAVATCAIAAADGAEADGAADGAEDGAAAGGAAASSREELFVRCLLYSGYACAGDVSAEWRLADGGVATAHAYPL